MEENVIVKKVVPSWMKLFFVFFVLILVAFFAIGAGMLQEEKTNLQHLSFCGSLNRAMVNNATNSDHSGFCAAWSTYRIANCPIEQTRIYEINQYCG